MTKSTFEEWFADLTKELQERGTIPGEAEAEQLRREREDPDTDTDTDTDIFDELNLEALKLDGASDEVFPTAPTEECDHTHEIRIDQVHSHHHKVCTRISPPAGKPHFPVNEGKYAEGFDTWYIPFPQEGKQPTIALWAHAFDAGAALSEEWRRMKIHIPGKAAFCKVAMIDVWGNILTAPRTYERDMVLHVVRPIEKAAYLVLLGCSSGDVLTRMPILSLDDIGRVRTFELPEEAVSIHVGSCGMHWSRTHDKHYHMHSDAYGWILDQTHR